LPQSIRKLKLYQTLTHRPIFMLWAGEALSAVGDEIYRVALTWIAVGLVGENTGYLSAAQAASLFFFSLVGGYWSDRWDSRRTMYWSDIARGAVVLVPVAWIWFFPLNIWILGLVAVAVAGISSFFEPALQAAIPRLAPSRALLQATNGLMGTTMRLARALGPSIVGVLTPVLPLVHFFTLDAVSFALSAYAVKKLKPWLPVSKAAPKVRGSFRASLLVGWQLVQKDQLMKYVLIAKALTTGVWHLVLPLGVALLVKEHHANSVQAYGLLLGSYGFGNIMAALVITNINIVRPMWVMGAGFLALGLGFAGLASFDSISLMGVSLFFAALGGPMNDLAHIDIIQNRFPAEKIPAIVRFRIAVECAGMLFFMLLAPMLFRTWGTRGTIFFAGIVTLLVGASGLVWFRERKPRIFN
jgi:MFS transporter, DHA3 family, macrolide efflux protein